MCSESKYIGFLGKTTQGSMHDKTLLELEFKTQEDWFKEMEIWVDLGYIGIDKLYNFKKLCIPIKKKRRKKGMEKDTLNKEQKQKNKGMSTKRVLVENAICGLKRLAILVNVYRNKKLNFEDLIIAIAAGLWNLHLTI